jgi:hypothetical protein
MKPYLVALSAHSVTRNSDFYEKRSLLLASKDKLKSNSKRRAKDQRQQE